MRRKIVVGNWKMFKLPGEAMRDFNEFVEISGGLWDRIDLGIAAPTIALSGLSAIRARGVGVYAQNSHWEKEGAFTGEVSVSMIADLHLNGSVIGHSERRQYFGETNVTAGKRVGALVRAGLECIFCIGETLAERERGDLKKVLRAQLVEGFEAANLKSASDVVGSDAVRPLLSIAYEPVWAIGTGKAATPVEAQEAHAFVREVLGEVFGATCAQQLRILYGGSVNPANASSFMSCADIDGALVGGASLKPVGFLELCTKVAAV
jgi:triosephosphate isomerase